MFNLAQDMQDPLDLSLGMSDFPVSDSVKQAVVESIESGSSGYSVNAGDLKVRKKIVEKLVEKNNIQAKEDEIIITSGATGGLLLSLATVLDPGDEIMIFDPYFVLYKQISTFLGAKPIFVSTYPNWDLPIEKMEELVTPRTKAVLFNSPNNPTGRVYTKDEITKLAKFAEKYDLTIISDEVYEEFVYEGDHFSIGSIYPQTITLMGPSKSAALAGWRVGYLHASKEVVEQMMKVQQIFYVCAPRLAQVALAASLDLDYKSILSKYTEKKSIVKEILGEYPGVQGAFYAFLPAPNDDAAALVTSLVKDNLLIVAGEVFSEQNTHFRIAYSMPDDKLRKALEIIKKYLV